MATKTMKQQEEEGAGDNMDLKNYKEIYANDDNT